MIFWSLPIREQERGRRISGMPMLDGWRTAIIALLVIVCLCSAHASAQTNPPRLVGVGSCTAAGCHGAANTKSSVIGSEYNLWVAQDPHARAYSILFDERSQRIERLLNRSPSNPPMAAYEDPRCLACHATTEAPERDPNLDVVSDGVSCESCHGPASNWLSTHYERKSDTERRRGMSETKNLLVRAQICARCHVGSAGEDANHDRDVNHDLIAAGHPRLQFEMSAYLQAMPKHWDEKKDRARWGADFDALVWAIGQAATSQAAAMQLASRAGKTDTKKPWPEFSEWTCSSCHHDLQFEEGERRQAELGKIGRGPGRLFEWDTWNHFVSRKHAKELSEAFSLDPAAGERVAKITETLAVEMRKIHPDREKVSEFARRAANELGVWGGDIERRFLAEPPEKVPVKINRLTQSLWRAQVESPVANWSSAALTYDGLVSLHETRLRRAGSIEEPPRDPLSQLMQGLFRDLSAHHRTPGDQLHQTDEMAKRVKELTERVSKLEAEK